LIELNTAFPADYKKRARAVQLTPIQQIKSDKAFEALNRYCHLYRILFDGAKFVFD
jgi:hypothetical protein